MDAGYFLYQPELSRTIFDAVADQEMRISVIDRVTVMTNADPAHIFVLQLPIEYKRAEEGDVQYHQLILDMASAQN